MPPICAPNGSLDRLNFLVSLRTIVETSFAAILPSRPFATASKCRALGSAITLACIDKP